MTTHEVKVLIERCVKEDPDARREFQEHYGAFIYSFPIHIYRLPEDEAGDFYLYVFEEDRIFKRVRSFEGKNDIRFENYLSFHVLTHLFLEWRRTMDRVETVSLDAPIMAAEGGGDRSITMQDVLAAEAPAPEAALVGTEEIKAVESKLRQMDAEKGLVLKLLALGTLELEPDDIRMIARMASRSIIETLELIEDVTEALAAKRTKVQDKEDTLYTVSFWILTYQRQLAALNAQLHGRRVHGNAPHVERLMHDKAELERKLAWRYDQQRRLQEEIQRADVRPSYKDIARILNVPVGTICSKIARSREDLGRQLALARGERE